MTLAEQTASWCACSALTCERSAWRGVAYPHSVPGRSCALQNHGLHDPAAPELLLQRQPARPELCLRETLHSEIMHPLLTRHMKSEGTSVQAVNPLNKVTVVCYHKLVFCENNVGCVVFSQHSMKAA